MYMMKKQYLAVLLSVTCCLFTGCGSSGMNAAYDSNSYKMEMEAPGEMYYADMDMAEMETVTMETSASVSGGTGLKNMTASESGANTGNNDLAARKLIRNASLELETKEYDTFIDALEKQLATCGAYVQNGETSGSAERGTRWAYYTIRVPESKYDTFLSTVSALANVLHKNENVEDVTMSYTDMEARVRALETERDTLLAIMEKCTELKDVITVQERITNVQYELDSVNSRLKRYDDLIAYCTINLTISEVKKETIPVAEKTLGQRITEQLAYNCEEIAEGAKIFAVWFVSSLPYFGIWLVVAAVLLVAALMIGKRSKRKLAERQKKREAARAQAAANAMQNTPDKQVSNHPME